MSFALKQEAINHTAFYQSREYWLFKMDLDEIPSHSGVAIAAMADLREGDDSHMDFAVVFAVILYMDQFADRIYRVGGRDAQLAEGRSLPADNRAACDAWLRRWYQLG